MAVDPRNFLVNSDYPLDKVVYLNSSSASIGGGTTITIPHGLPFTPLVDLTWSYNSNFATSYTNNTGPAPASVPWFIFDLQVYVDADATNIYIEAYGPAAATTVYYRVFGFQPSTSNVAVDFTAPSADNFALNTDYNYTKLLAQGTEAHGTGVVSITIPHNLGHIPQVQVWRQSSSRTSMLSFSGDPASFSWQIEVTTSSVILYNPGMFVTGTLHYRIYIDE